MSAMGRTAPEIDYDLLLKEKRAEVKEEALKLPPAMQRGVCGGRNWVLRCLSDPSEWQRRLTASKVKSICRVGDKSPSDAYNVMKGLKPKRKTQKYDVRGLDLEPRGVAAIENTTGVVFFHTDELLQRFYTCHLSTEDRNGEPYILGATPDGLNFTKDDRAGCEVKCPPKIEHIVSGLYEHEIPPHYQLQLCTQLYVCNLRDIYFAAWHEDYKKIWIVNQEPDLLQWMLLRCNEFCECLRDDRKPRRAARGEKDEIIKTMPRLKSELIYEGA